jgi:hypothetical protein
MKGNHGNTVLIILLMIISWGCTSQSKVIILNLPEEKIFFHPDHKKLTYKRLPEGAVCLDKKLSPGNYVIFFDENSGVRNYASLRIKKKPEEIKLNFRRQVLPEIHKELIADNGGRAELISKGWNYVIFNEKNREIEYRAELNAVILGELDESFIFRWWFSIDGSGEDDNEIVLEPEQILEIVLFEDKFHKINLAIQTSENKATLDLKSEFKKY